MTKEEFKKLIIKGTFSVSSYTSCPVVIYGKDPSARQYIIITIEGGKFEVSEENVSIFGEIVIAYRSQVKDIRDPLEKKKIWISEYPEEWKYISIDDIADVKIFNYDEFLEKFEPEKQLLEFINRDIAEAMYSEIMSRISASSTLPLISCNTERYSTFSTTPDGKLVVEIGPILYGLRMGNPVEVGEFYNTPEDKERLYKFVKDYYIPESK